MPECPDIYTLERLATKKLADDASADILVHTSSCATCREVLDDLQENAVLEGEVRSRLARVADPSMPRIPGIEIEKEIGHGGQGVVWKGRQIATGRHVAVKTTTHGVLSSATRRARFLREVEIAASLRHPNIVTVFDGGQAADLTPYLTMEWVDGLRLDLWCTAAPRTVDELVRVFYGIAEGVRHAHRHGVLHRDLKPGNVIVDADGTPRVLDFGLAKRLTSDGEDATSAGTTTGEFVGTLAYAAPEQLDSRSDDDADVRTDIHGLGAVFFAMLVGHAPYVQGTDIHATIRAVVDQEPPRASHKRPDVDRDLDALIIKALAKRVEDRYASVDDLLRDLDRRARGDVLEARRGERRHVLQRTMRRYNGRSPSRRSRHSRSSARRFFPGRPGGVPRARTRGCCRRSRGATFKRNAPTKSSRRFATL